jgi:hypothetical protein
MSGLEFAWAYLDDLLILSTEKGCSSCLVAIVSLTLLAPFWTLILWQSYPDGIEFLFLR